MREGGADLRTGEISTVPKSGSTWKTQNLEALTMTEHPTERNWKIYETESVTIERIIRLDNIQEVWVKGFHRGETGQLGVDCIKITLVLSSTVDKYGDEATQMRVWDHKVGWCDLADEAEFDRVKSFIPDKYFVPVAQAEDTTHPSESEN